MFVNTLLASRDLLVISHTERGPLVSVTNEVRLCLRCEEVSWLGSVSQGPVRDYDCAALDGFGAGLVSLRGLSSQAPAAMRRSQRPPSADTTFEGSKDH